MKRSKRTTHSVDPAEIEKNAGNNLERRVFSEMLNLLLERRGVDQIKMAEDLGISSGAIHNYRAGVTDPKLTTIVKMADYLGVDCDYLIRGVETKHTNVAELGLTNESIERLLWLSTGTWKRRINALNGLLNMSDFIFVLDYLDRIQKLCEEIAKIDANYQKKIESCLKSEDRRFAFRTLDNFCGEISKLKRDLRYTVFELSESIKGTANQLYKYEDFSRLVDTLGNDVFDQMNKNFNEEEWHDFCEY